MNFKTPHLSRVVTLAVLLFLGMAGQRSAQAQRPVRWTRAVGPPSRQALEAKFRQPVKKPRSQRIYEAKREIRTCASYARAKMSGWKAADGYEFATEAFFKDQCQTIAVVLAAKPSRVSYLKNFKLDEAALDLLPPTLTFAPFGEVEEAADKAEQQGLSWKKFRPGLKIQYKSANEITVLEPGLDNQGKPGPQGDVKVDLEIKAFGDFNGDGIEDVLLFKEGHPVEGTFSSYELVILTRVTAGGPLKAFDVDDAEIEKAMARATGSWTARPAKAHALKGR
jgi:hypothetical protein